jgi:hypothetical protein
VLFGLCRVAARIGVALGIWKDGPWTADYFAVSLYANFRPLHAADLAQLLFPEE